MSIYTVVNLVIIIGVILAPLTIFTFVFGLFRNMKSDKRESLEMTSTVQNTMYSLLMAMLMRSPQQPNVNAAFNQKQHSNPKDDMNGFVDWNNNNDFYEDLKNNSQYNAQPMLNNARTVAKSNNNHSFLIGLLSGLFIFMALALITVLKFN